MEKVRKRKSRFLWIKTEIFMIQDLVPGRIQAIYLINPPFILKPLLAIAKLLVKAKLIKRVCSNSLYFFFPNEICIGTYSSTQSRYFQIHWQRAPTWTLWRRFEVSFPIAFPSFFIFDQTRTRALRVLISKPVYLLNYLFAQSM